VCIEKIRTTLGFLIYYRSNKGYLWASASRLKNTFNYSAVGAYFVNSIKVGHIRFLGLLQCRVVFSLKRFAVPSHGPKHHGLSWHVYSFGAHWRNRCQFYNQTPEESQARLQATAKGCHQKNLENLRAGLLRGDSY